MKAYKLLDESIIWEDGSRTYPPKMARPADPAGTWPWSPPAGATVVEIATETPAQYPGIAVGEPYPGPVVSPAPPGPVVSPAFPGPAPAATPRHEIDPLPVVASALDTWDRWQRLVTGWGCVIAWGGGDLDKLAVAIGDTPLYKQQITMLGVIQNAGDVQLPELVGSTLWEDGSRTYPPIKVKGGDDVLRPPDLPGRWGWPRPGTPTSKTIDKFKTAIGWWRHVQALRADKATSAAEIAKGLDVRGLVEQFNDLAKVARSKGYRGCPPPSPPPGAPPPAPPSPADTAISTISDARAGIGRAWAGLSPRGKLVAGAAGLTGAILILRGVTK